MNTFARRIAPHVEATLADACQARAAGDTQQEFTHLERAHVMGQASTYWHVKIHILMMGWAIRNRSMHELFGKIIRIIGAATKTAFGLVPTGNTGGANVSPFKRMPVAPDVAALIEKAKSGAEDKATS